MANRSADQWFFSPIFIPNRCFWTCLVSDNLLSLPVHPPRSLLRRNLLVVHTPVATFLCAPLHTRLPVLVEGSCPSIGYASSRTLPIEPSPHFLSDVHRTYAIDSSAKDQLMGTSVAIKKIMKPFSTPVLSKRTYRELKLLKHIQHENIIALSDVFISPLEDIYFVTELLGTDLHRLLTSRPLEKQFIQYFLYQILVRLDYVVFTPHECDSYLQRGLKYVHSAGVVHRDLVTCGTLVLYCQSSSFAALRNRPIFSSMKTAI